MAEVHIIGEIESASGFPEQRLFCRWELELGGGWRVVQGISKGQTQTDLSEYEDTAYFSHPLDIHLATKTVQAIHPLDDAEMARATLAIRRIDRWPSINLQIWHYDEFGRQELYGYGSIFIPSSPGEHQIECYTWRPKGDLREEMMQYFVGGSLQLTNERSTRLNELPKLHTVSMGAVKIRVSVITKHFDHFGIQC